MSELITMAQNAKTASYSLMGISSAEKDAALEAIAQALTDNTEDIIKANNMDIEKAEAKGMEKAMLDRLTLTADRIQGIANGVREVIALTDPVGEVVSMWKRPNGLTIGQQRVPLGVIGIIYESRPNVTVDAAVLCLKSGNAVILRGGSEAIHSNIALMDIMRGAVESTGLDPNCMCLIHDTSRETAAEMMKLNGYIDVLIPRGGAGLIKTVVQTATVPVIETGTGNCHIYVDSDCDRKMAMDILINAKVSRPSVCNAAETLLVDTPIAKDFIPLAVAKLIKNGVEVRGCKIAQDICSVEANVKPATEEDYYTEYNDYIIAVKVVDGLDAAIAHINKYNTKHSEAIVTNSYAKAQKFLQQVDAAAVYVNASTRFTDGGEFGFGAEIGISNQKIHARGPMGLKELTTIKYIIYGSGQIR